MLSHGYRLYVEEYRTFSELPLKPVKYPARHVLSVRPSIGDEYLASSLASRRVASREQRVNESIVPEAMKPERHPSVRGWLDAQAAETVFLSSERAAGARTGWQLHSTAYCDRGAFKAAGLTIIDP